VFGAIYSDESGNEQTGRIGIAASLASIQNWTELEAEWRQVLVFANREHEFHAVENDRTQYALNVTLAWLMKKWRVATVCITVRERDYLENTTALQRGWYGDAYAFARYVSLVYTGESIRRLNKGDFGHYVEQGGRGFDWIMQTLGLIYKSDQLRPKYRMATYGPVDRRIHLPAHAADLVAHEVITNRHKSAALSLLGENVVIEDVAGDTIETIMTEFAEIRKVIAKLKNDHRARRRESRRNS
jgi:hypothetical protein